jgi:Ala-tRNA(Pro) deacylase
VLQGRQRGYLMAVIPANHRLDLEEMGEYFADEMALASERNLEKLFPDCAPGAIPPVGDAYGIRTFWDTHLGDCRDVYFEGGDHRTLVHVNGADFATLMRGARPIHHLH